MLRSITGALGAATRSLICAASASAAVEALPSLARHHKGTTRYLTGRAKNGWSHFDPRINRHTGRPHEHRREIARNLKRQGITA